MEGVEGDVMSEFEMIDVSGVCAGMMELRMCSSMFCVLAVCSFDAKVSPFSACTHAHAHAHAHTHTHAHTFIVFVTVVV